MKVWVTYKASDGSEPMRAFDSLDSAAGYVAGKITKEIGIADAEWSRVGIVPPGHDGYSHASIIEWHNDRFDDDQWVIEEVSVMTLKNGLLVEANP